MISTTRAAWLTALKDLRAYCRDRNGLVLGLLLPIALVAVFGFVQKIAFGGSGGLSSVTLWLIDEDQTQASMDFVKAVKSSTMVRVRPGQGDESEDGNSLRSKIEEGDAHHALIIHQGFEVSKESESFPRMTLIRDPDRHIESQMISIALLQGFFESMGSEMSPMLASRVMEMAGLPKEWASRAQFLAKTMDSSVRTLFQSAEKEGALDASGDESPSLNFQTVMNELVPLEREDIRPPERPQQLSYMLAQSVSGISVMMLMFGLMACSTMMIRERESGTLSRLLTLPVSRESYLWGKFIFCALMGYVQLAILFVFGEIVFGVGMFRDPVTLIILSSALVFAVTGFGMLVASWASTTKQAEGVSTLLILVMSALGGAWFPIQMVEIPFPATIPVKSTLTYWAMSGYQGMLWQGKAWNDPSLLTCIAVLAAFGFGASALARMFFLRRYVKRA